MTSADDTTTRSGNLSTKLLPELRTIAAGLGIKGSSGMRKAALVDAIRAAQSGSSSAPAKKSALHTSGEENTSEEKTSQRQEKTQQTGDSSQDGESGAQRQGRPRRRRNASADTESSPESTQESTEKPSTDSGESSDEGEENNSRSRRDRNNNRRGRNNNRRSSDNRENQDNADNDDNSDKQRGDSRQERDEESGGRGRGRNNNNRRGRNNNNRDDDERGGRRNRRQRDRRGRRGDENEITEDDVLQPVAGILDVLDNYAFVRTTGYIAGPNDVYVSMNMVRRHGLRRGDALVGSVRMPREGEHNNRQKFNPMVKIETVNGLPLEQAKDRPDFSKLTPLYPNQRLRLETEQNVLSNRVIDLVMPIGKGQRALIVSPPKAGKTTILQNIANAIAKNNPECHLMVVLVDERPEEVTDMQRSVRGEVIASTFDRPPLDHTTVAELAIERAKRIVEMGNDVVVLLDSITRLGRAYNNSSPASGRILSGGVDSTALYPPKRFLGAARNIEDGGSLTIIATAMVETGSAGDTVIFEEFKGTGNAELKLDRKIAERRVFPAVDVQPSGTRKEELLMSTEEAQIIHKLRRVLAGLDSHQAIDLLLDRLRKSKSNMEFLMQVSKTTPDENEADNA